VAENGQTGSPASEWDLGSPDSSAIEGFATDISLDRGQTVRFRVKTAGVRTLLPVQPVPSAAGQRR
jgi:hypothetical protein